MFGFQPKDESSILSGRFMKFNTDTNTLYVSKAEHILLQKNEEISAMFGVENGLETFLASQLSPEEMEAINNVNQIQVELVEE